MFDQSDWLAVVGAIHRAGRPCVLALTGGGAAALSALLSVPGGSRTLLEAVVPYSSQALTDFLGRQPESYCSEDTALAMAVAAWKRAQFLSAENLAPAQGLGATASLVSDRPKRGEHRIHVAVHASAFTHVYRLVLTKGARSRREEENLASGVVLWALARSCGVPAAGIPALPLLPGEAVQFDGVEAPVPLIKLRAGRNAVVWSLPDGRLIEPDTFDDTHGFDAPPVVPSWAVSVLRAPREIAREDRVPPPPWRAVLSGAFNPRHAGHEELLATATAKVGLPGCYELSLENVDKPPLDHLTVARRRRQFAEAQAPLALTCAPTFVEKSRVLPGSVFVVGTDTAERIIDPRYYANSASGVCDALREIRERGCRFLVAGRVREGAFFAASALRVPAGFEDLFASLGEDEYRCDISSTELRRIARDGGDGVSGDVAER